MTELSRKMVLDTLSTVKVSPDGPSVVDAGLISGLTIDGRSVAFSLDAGERADAESLKPVRDACEAALKALSEIDQAYVVLSAVRAPQSPAPAGPPQPPGPKRGHPIPAAKGPVPGVRHVIAVSSGKGGVGKSTVSANLAVALGRLGLQVGLMDADIYGPSVPTLLGLSKRAEAKDKRLQPMTAHGIKALSIGTMLDPEKAVIWRGPMVITAVTQLLYESDWAPLDVLVVDMPPGTGDAALTLAQKVPLSGAVVVSTPQDLALIDARKAIAMWRKVHVPVLGLVENMSYFLCPHCGERSDIFGHAGAKDTAQAWDIPFLGEIPLHAHIRERSDAGEPPAAGDSPQAAPFAALARTLADALSVAMSGR
ncbi:MAG: P-loop NTPase [Rhodothalassiaceae bacterium]